MTIVDARGQICPVPLIMLKKALKGLESPFEIQILVDNEISQINILTYLKDNHFQAESQKINDFWKIITTDAQQLGMEMTPSLPLLTEEVGLPPSVRGNFYVVVIKNNKMGFGNDDLCENLLKGFLNVLTEIEEKPQYLIFYNAGVHLTTKMSLVINSLKKLEDDGVKLIICGACVDFYGLKNEIGIGTISNMYSITEILLQAEKIIYP